MSDLTPARVTPARVSVFSIHSGQTVQNDVGFADHARAHAEKHDDWFAQLCAVACAAGPVGNQAEQTSRRARCNDMQAPLSLSALNHA